MTRSDVDADVGVGPNEASGRASASIAARRGAGGCDAGMSGAERRREDWRAARDSFVSRRSGSHHLKSLDELTPRAHLRAGRAVSHSLFPARLHVGRPSRRRLAPRVDGSSRFARARKFDREPSRVFLFRHPSSSRGVAPRAQDRGGDPRVARAVAAGRGVHHPPALLARFPLTGKERVHVSIDLNTDSDSDPDADVDAVRADDALASRRASERAAELTAENARLRGLLDESDAKRRAPRRASATPSIPPASPTAPPRTAPSTSTSSPATPPRPSNARFSPRTPSSAGTSARTKPPRHPRRRETPRRGHGGETPRPTRARRRRDRASSHTPGSRRAERSERSNPNPIRPRDDPRPGRRDRRRQRQKNHRRWQGARASPRG